MLLADGTLCGDIAAQSNIADILACNSSHHAKIRNSMVKRVLGSDMKVHINLASIWLHRIANHAKVRYRLPGKDSCVNVMAYSELEAIWVCNSAHHTKARAAARVGELANFDLNMEKSLKLIWTNFVSRSP